MVDAVAAPADAPAPLSIDPTAPVHACRNCGSHATGHYCANCGQETRVALPTFGTFMREAAGRYVALDGRLWRTLFALVARPGFLTLEYFSGRRTLRLGNTDVPIPAQVRKRYDHFKKLSKEEQAEQLYARVLRYGPYAMVVLLPAFALLLKLAYLGRGGRYPGRPRRYAEHLVYSAHLHAFAALAILLILLLPFAPLRYAIMAWIVFYVMRARQIVYRGRWWGGLLRAVAIAVVYVVLMALAIAGLLAMAVMLR